MSNSANASYLSGLQARAVAVLLEINHLRAIATDPAPLDELGDVLDLIDQVSTLVGDVPTADSSHDIEMVLTTIRRRLHVIHNALALAERNAAVRRDGRLGS